MKDIEVAKFRGYPITTNEEAFRSPLFFFFLTFKKPIQIKKKIRAKLQNIQKELNSPNKFKGRLNELTSIVRIYEEQPQGKFQLNLFLEAKQSK